MHSDEPVLHSFVVRIWLEDSVENDRQVKWRGQITHLPGNESHSFNDLQNIAAFIRLYLSYPKGTEDTAEPVAVDKRFRQRLSRWWRRLSGSRR